MNGIAIGALLVFATAKAGGQGLPEDVMTLARTMNASRDLLKRVPLYTCLETMERSRPKVRGRSSSHDVVQVDVGVGDGNEMYSWPSDSSFSSLNLPDLVVNGMLSTGMFSGFAHNLFVGQHGIVRFAGKAAINGHDAFHFTYTVPSLGNRWKIDWDGVHGELLQHHFRGYLLRRYVQPLQMKIPRVGKRITTAWHFRIVMCFRLSRRCPRAMWM